MNKKAVQLSLLFLVIATILFAIGPAVVKLLVERGGEFGIKNPGAVSFCNVLFVGNLCASLVVLAIYGIRGIVQELRQLPKKVKMYLGLGSIMSAIYPSLIFIALEHTSIINLVLLSRLNGIVYLIFAFFILKQRFPALEIVGYAIMAIGVGILVVINNMGSLQVGDMLILSATVFFAINEIISKKIVPHCSVPTFVFTRNFLSAVIFFFIVIIFFGVDHFAQAFEGELWILMLVYAGVAVVLAQIFWLKAIKVVPVTYVANIKLFDPVFSITFAYFLLQEKPDLSEWIIMGVILVGILVPKLLMRKKKPTELDLTSIDTSLVGR